MQPVGDERPVSCGTTISLRLTASVLASYYAVKRDKYVHM